MESLVQLLFETLTTYPGNLTYHLVLAFSISGALYVAIQQWNSLPAPQNKRLISGLGALLFLRFIFFLLTGFAWQGLATPTLLLPSIDRGVTAVSLVVIIWVWAFPESLRAADAAAFIVGLLGVFLLIFSTMTWSNATDPGTFNQHSLNTVWEGLSSTLIVVGVFLLLIRQPPGWGLGIGLFGILFIGHAIQLAIPDPFSDFPGAVRLAQIAGYPLLLSLPLRFSTATATGMDQKQQEIQIERRVGNHTTGLFSTIHAIISSDSPEGIGRAITRLSAILMRADLSLLISHPDEDGMVHVHSGFNLIREQPTPSVELNMNLLPVICAAMERKRALRLPANSRSPDLDNLANHLGMETVGNLLAIPLSRENEIEQTAGILLLSPYSKYNWTMEDQSTMTSISDTLTEILQNQTHQLEYPSEGPQPDISEVEILLNENEVLKSRLSELEKVISENQTTAESMASLIAANEHAQEIIQELQSENDRLKRIRLETPVENETAIEELRLALEEIAELQKKLADAENRLRASSVGEEDQAETLASLTQELRQPMSSILGYTDLLLSESVGILGTLQIKFLERIKVSIERMKELVDELIQSTSVDLGKVKIEPGPVNLATIIDDAISLTRAQLREKRIALRVDLPDSLPKLQADQDALQQILVQLLQNAGTATPVEGEIALRARTDQNGFESHILIQVADTGGGIPDEDLHRVFSRQYHVENNQISGLGDTGIGLAIAKALVEAHHGQIWVDSELGLGSTFSVVLPIPTTESPPQDGGGGAEL